MAKEEEEAYDTFYSDQELESAIKIFRIYLGNPHLKDQARTNDRLKFLFSLAQKTLAPTKDALKEYKKKNINSRKLEDNLKLNNTVIRKSRGLKTVGSSTGSAIMEMPPRLGREDLEIYARNEDTFITDKIDKDDKKVLDLGLKESPTNTLVDKILLNYIRSCHICPAGFKELHHFYDQLCPRCASFNYAKRSYTADLTGRVSLVTGARVKIGYCIALKLLRMNSTVIITTRFPHDAATRYAKESDFKSFKNRIFIYGIDFRDIQMTHAFCVDVKKKFTRLDIIINNAAQTVRKPVSFYKHLIANESAVVHQSILDIISVVNVYKTGGGYQFLESGKGGEMVPTPVQQAVSSLSELGTTDIGVSAHDPESVLHNNHSGVVTNSSNQTGEIINNINQSGAISNSSNQSGEIINNFNNSGAVTNSSNQSEEIINNINQSGLVTNPSFININRSALLSQVPVVDHDLMEDRKLFPTGLYDRDDQQIDLRKENSWTQEIGQISTFEMLECHVINAFAPWVIISELKPLMMKTLKLPDGAKSDKYNVNDGIGIKCDKYIVNVSAMEGQFYRPKTTNHPHSNMAKASLNMLTRTSASGFAAIDIFMTAVDTGWITDENPVGEWDKRGNAPPPLDEWDAAMRVLDPVLTGVNGEEKVWGCFLKNYNPTRW